MKHTIVCGSIIENEDKIAFVQESKESAYGKWNLPAGRLEKDESCIEGAKREAKEELNLNIKPESIIGIYTKDGEKSDVTLIIIFKSSLESNPSNLKPNKKHVLNGKWIPVNEINNYNLRSKYIENSIEDYKNGKEYNLELFTNIN